MTRQLEVEQEKVAIAKRNHLVKALEFGIVGALESQGIELLGFAAKYDAFNCLLTVKAYVGGVRSVCFIGSDSIINCFLKLESEASRNELKWRPDKYNKA